MKYVCDTDGQRSDKTEVRDHDGADDSDDVDSQVSNALSHSDEMLRRCLSG